MFKVYLIPFILGILHMGYILVALIFGKIEKESRAEEANEKESSVEHIICFKNESKFIKKKLGNCYTLDHPRIHNTFVNDNSTDNTLELLKKYKGENSQIVSNETNLGKNQSQIKAVNKTESDFLLFTDANVFLEKDALNKILRAFNKNTGGVCGNVKITTDMQHQDMSGKYWELEKIIKKFQSLFSSVIGFDGGFYCVRRANYTLTRKNELSDFETAFLIFEQQKQTKYVRDAQATELEKRKIKDSFKARIRASNRAFWSYFRIFQYIKRLNASVLIHLTFHKLIRYLFIITFVLCLPFIVIDLMKITPWLLFVFLIPHVMRFAIESVALCVGGVIALTGKEYTVWSQKKT